MEPARRGHHSGKTLGLVTVTGGVADRTWRTVLGQEHPIPPRPVLDVPPDEDDEECPF